MNDTTESVAQGMAYQKVRVWIVRQSTDRTPEERPKGQRKLPQNNT